MLLDRVEPSVGPGVDLDREEAGDPAEPAFRQVLERLQGNILKAHARDHMDLLLLRFTAPAGEVRAWVRSYALSWTTSAWEQLQEDRRGSGVFGGLYLTAAGYEALGFPRREIEARFGHREEIVRFTAGMAAARQELNDVPACEWDEPYRSPGAIHAMALLAANSRDLLAWAKSRLDRSLAGVGTLLHREAGAVLRNDAGQWIEPFGFADGRSQPVFLKEQLEHETNRRGVGPWNPVAPLGLALVPDPFIDRADCLGSYLVYRKLRQDVEGFRRRITELAERLTNGDERLAEALVVGRFKNGTPLAQHGEERTGLEREANGFDHGGDFRGARCPFHAHIRKVNPRTDAGRSHRIVRRGMPYKESNGDQGMLFLCFQSRIHHQFAHIQRNWANAPGFPRPDVGVDPLIGRPGFRERPDQHWQTRWDARPTEGYDFSGLVTLKGGEFFFAPSLPFLTGL